ncbi:MAG: HAD-IA family hydrolase [Ferruginibacter sp.]
MQDQLITTLFLDIGGVLLTNGWGRASRAVAAKKFNLDLPEMEERHHLCFDTYEMGKLSMDDYLKEIVFYEKRDFPKEVFKEFIFEQSQPLPGCIDFFKEVKARYKIKIISVNNEAKEMNEYRIRQFKLRDLFDAFVSSCYVGLRKPDKDIFILACNLAQVNPQNALLIDDRQMFVEVAASIGLNVIRFEGLDAVKEKMELFRFAVETPDI